jgi:hypothetical protein
MFYNGAPPINEFSRHTKFSNIALKMETDKSSEESATKTKSLYTSATLLKLKLNNNFHKLCGRRFHYVFSVTGGQNYVVRLTEVTTTSRKIMFLGSKAAVDAWDP